MHDVISPRVSSDEKSGYHVRSSFQLMSTSCLFLEFPRICYPIVFLKKWMLLSKITSRLSGSGRQCVMFFGENLNFHYLKKKKVNSRNSATCELATFLLLFVQPLEGNLPPQHFVEILKPIEPKDNLVSFAIKSNAKLREGLRIKMKGPIYPLRSLWIHSNAAAVVYRKLVLLSVSPEVIPTFDFKSSTLYIIF